MCHGVRCYVTIARGCRLPTWLTKGWILHEFVGLLVKYHYFPIKWKIALPDPRTTKKKLIKYKFFRTLVSCDCIHSSHYSFISWQWVTLPSSVLHTFVECFHSRTLRMHSRSENSLFAEKRYLPLSSSGIDSNQSECAEKQCESALRKTTTKCQTDYGDYRYISLRFDSLFCAASTIIKKWHILVVFWMQSPFFSIFFSFESFLYIFCEPALGSWARCKETT